MINQTKPSSRRANETATGVDYQLWDLGRREWVNCLPRTWSYKWTQLILQCTHLFVSALLLRLCIILERCLVWLGAMWFLYLFLAVWSCFRSVHCFICILLWLQHEALGCINDVSIMCMLIRVTVWDPTSLLSLKNCQNLCQRNVAFSVHSAIWKLSSPSAIWRPSSPWIQNKT